MEPLKKDAKDGGAVAGRTRKDIEKQSGQPVISSANFKQLTGKGTKKLKRGALTILKIFFHYLIAANVVIPYFGGYAFKIIGFINKY